MGSKARKKKDLLALTYLNAGKDPSCIGRSLLPGFLHGALPDIGKPDDGVGNKGGLIALATVRNRSQIGAICLYHNAVVRQYAKDVGEGRFLIGENTADT